VSTTAAGLTFTLTTGTDLGAAFTGGSGNDTFNASTSNTLSSLDALNGGDGTDTLTAVITGTILPSALSITNIETASITTSGAGFTADMTGWTGLTSLTVIDTAAGNVSVTGAATTAANIVATGTSGVTVIGTGGALTATTAGGAVTIGGTAVANAITSATVTGGTTVAVTDRSGASAATGSALTTVSVIGNSASDDVSITANGLTTLNLTGLTGATTVGDTTVTAAAGTRALTVTYNGVDEGAAGADAGTLNMTDATATTINVKAVGSASNDITIVGAAATAYTVDAAVALKLDALNTVTTVATTVGISGAGAVTITADSLATNAVITSTNTGGVTLTQQLLAGQQFVGTSSSGKDSISVAATSTVADTTGAGDDTVIIGGAFGTGGSVDAGDGTGDTLSLTVALAANDSLSASTTFAGKISNFEILNLSDSAAKTINMDNLDSLATVNRAVAVANATQFDNFANNGKMIFNAANSAATTVNVKDAGNAGHSSDAITVDLLAATLGGTIAYNTLTVASVENFTINSKGSGTMVAADTNTMSLVAANAATITITGGVDLNLTSALNNAALATIDASANTDGLTVSTAGATQGITIKGSTAGANSLTGGDGGDAITGGAGVDTIVGNAANDTIVAGGGADTITPGTGNDTIDLTETTSAVDTIKFAESSTANKDTVTGFKAGTDIVSISIGNLANSTTAGNDTLSNVAGTDIGGALAAGAFTAVAVSATATATTLADATDLVVFTNTAATTFATAIGTATLVATTGGNTAGFGGTEGLAAVWYDATNSQAVFGYMTDSNAAGTAFTAADTFVEIVRVGMTSTDFTLANIDASMSAY
jgi:S-layer protein